MQYLVVIDTNIIVSALLSKHENAATVQVISALFDAKFTPIYNDEILTEYNNVLHRAKFHFPESAIQAVLNYFMQYGLCIDRVDTGKDLPDPKDLVFYEVCMARRDEDVRGKMNLPSRGKEFFPLTVSIIFPPQ